MNQKISISMDENIIKLVDAERGDIPRSRYIENAIKSKGAFFEALWLSSDEIAGVTRKERWLSAHASQPIGKPLHKHEGYLSISENTLRFYSRDMDPLFSVDKNSIRGMAVTYDDLFRRFRDSRGLVPPLKLVLESKAIYLFTKTVGRTRLREYRTFRGDNETIESWYSSHS